MIIYSLGLAFLLVTTTSSQQFYGCEEKVKPPTDNVIQRYSVNLDLPPNQRWKDLMKDKGQDMITMVDLVKEAFEAIAGERVFHVVYNSLGKIAESLPPPYYEEIQGISSASGLPVPLVTLYNIFYEAFGFCTSIVAQDSQGNIYHARNLDNGAFFGWDVKNHTWILAENLSKLTVQIDWIKGGHLQYSSINFAGYVGILTAVKKDSFALSINKRIYPSHSYIGLLEWILLKNYNQRWVSFLTREVLENTKTYDDAVNILSDTNLLAPVYFIVSGLEPGEGVVITRDRKSKDLLRLDSSKEGQGSWYVVETNYDHWRPTPFFDSRREAAFQCLDKGEKNVSLSMLYDVLSTRPVLNKASVYTTLMRAQDGTFKSYRRTCPDPCWPW